MVSIGVVKLKVIKSNDSPKKKKFKNIPVRKMFS